MLFWNKKLVHYRQWILADIKHCARCNNDHEQLEFRKLTNPVVDCDDVTWEWWSLCPYSGEPILLRKESDD